MNDLNSEYKAKLYWLCEMIMFFVFGYIIGAVTFNKRYKDYTPIDNAKIDSLITVNDSIKIKIEKLDSIKDAKIIEVQTLDNNSTVKLFYELISK